MTVTKITPRSYRDSEEHRRVCDVLMAEAGVTAADVGHAELVDGSWHLTVYLRDSDGRKYLLPGQNEVATKIVTVEAVSTTTPT